MEENGDNEGDHIDMDSDHGGGVGAADDDEEEEQQYDISLAASHSYMGRGLTAMSGRRLLEAGWEGRVPVAAHHGAVFPGETVPMLLPHAARAADSAALARAIRHDRLFGLLCPDETGTVVTGYGVVCEVYEAGGGSDDEPDEPPAPAAHLSRPDDPVHPAAPVHPVDPYPPGDPAPRRPLSFKARAINRFRFVDMPKHTVPIQLYARMRFVDVRVLPEIPPAPPLRHVQLAGLDARRRSQSPDETTTPTGDTATPVNDSFRMARRVRSMDAAVAGWPLFVFEIFDYAAMRRHIRDYFRGLMLETHCGCVDKLPEDPVSLSFWVASNLALSARDRLALFVVDHALLRLHMEVRLIHTKSVLCCSSCMTEIARKEHIFPMSTEGVHSNYTNLGGYMHDVVTVSRVAHVALQGAPSTEYSWFPGYSWTIAACAACTAHVGWRFDALKRNLRPQRFFGICRNTVQPRHLISSSAVRADTP